MQRIITERFGELAIEESKVITFPEGLPGFPGEQQFLLLQQGLEQTPFTWMQSVDEGELCFLLVDPLAVFQGYAPQPNKQELKQLQAASPDGLQLYCLVSVPDGELRLATANLKAPLWINAASQLALQSILDDEAYGLRQPLFAEGGA